MRGQSPGVILLLALLVGAAATGWGQDRSRKSIEVVYEDVQALRQQVEELRARLDQQASEIRALQDQLKAVADLVRQAVTGQAVLAESVRTVPAQYQDLVRRIDLIAVELQRIAGDLAAARGPGAPSSGPPSQPSPTETGGQAAAPPAAKGAAEPKPAAAPPKAPPQTPGVSPQEAYSMAYNDYLRGNYDLAVEGFKLYRAQFPESPLADNALYWIGECRYSQRKFEEAIDAFDELIVAYPQGDKAAAAHLKKGLSFVELGRKDEALAALKLLVAKFPLEEESKIAREKIRELTEK